MQPRHALEWTEVDVDGAMTRRETLCTVEGSRGRGEAPPANGDGESLKEECNVGKNKGVVGADLGGGVGGSIVGGNGGEGFACGGRGGCNRGGHRIQRREGQLCGSDDEEEREVGLATLQQGGIRQIPDPRDKQTWQPT